MTSENISISSDSMEIDNKGNITLKGTEGELDSNIFLNSTVNEGINLYLNPARIVFKNQNKGREMFLMNVANGMWFKMNSGSKSITMVNDGQSFTQIDLDDGINITTIRPNEIVTPKLNQTSLERIKKNISIYNENVLETILNSDIYTYNLKSEKDTDSKHIGFVIGEGYRTPKQVINNEGNAIELYSAIGILWKGMQEQQKKIEELENKLKEVSNG